MQTRPAEASVRWEPTNFLALGQARPGSHPGNRPARCSPSTQRSSSRNRDPQGLMRELGLCYFVLPSSFGGAGAGAGALVSVLGAGLTAAGGTAGGLVVFAGSSGLHPLTSTTERPSPVASVSALNPSFFVTGLLLQRISDRRDDLRSPRTKGNKPPVVIRSSMDAITRRNVTDAYSSGLFPQVQRATSVFLKKSQPEKMIKSWTRIGRNETRKR
jgi:hypothetical protein